jgi:hypothetical protein
MAGRGARTIKSLAGPVGALARPVFRPSVCFQSLGTSRTLSGMAEKEEKINEIPSNTPIARRQRIVVFGGDRL